MTGLQLARLLPYGRNGETLSEYIPANSSTKIPYPGSYPKIMDMLQRMEANSEVKKSRDHGGQAYVWMLNNPNRKFSANWYNRQHELSAADIFVACQNAGIVEHWDDKWTNQELDYYDIKKTKVYYDRRMVAYGNVFFWEVDRGTEDGEQLEDKVQKYVNFSNRFPDEFFYVLFAMQGSRYYNLDGRLQYIQKMLRKMETPGYQFLVASHESIVTNPTGAIFNTYRSDEPLKLSELRT